MKKALLLLLLGIGIFSATAQNPAGYKPLEQFDGDISEYTLYNYCEYNTRPVNRKLGDFLDECEIDFKNYLYEDSILLLYAEYEYSNEIVMIWFCIKLGDYTDTPFYEDYMHLNPIHEDIGTYCDIEGIKDLADMNVGAYYTDILSIYIYNRQKNRA